MRTHSWSCINDIDNFFLHRVDNTDLMPIVPMLPEMAVCVSVAAVEEVAGLVVEEFVGFGN
jgi:hypothetical protein